MKQTTKPKDTKQSHSLKRDLARNVAALPLPTPSAGARGEGRFSTTAHCSSRRTENPNSKTEQHGSNELDPCFPLLIGSGEGSRVRGSVHWQTPFSSELNGCDYMEPPYVGCHATKRDSGSIDLRFPHFAAIAVRRDEPLLLSFVITNPTNNEFPITKRMI